MTTGRLLDPLHADGSLNIDELAEKLAVAAPLVPTDKNTVAPGPIWVEPEPQFPESESAEIGKALARLVPSCDPEPF